MKCKWVGRYDPSLRMFRLLRLMWVRGEVGTGGYSARWGRINPGDKPGETTIEIHGVWKDGVAYPVADCADSTNTDNRDETSGNT